MFRALCYSYNVYEYRLEIRPGHPLPQQIDMPVVRDAHMPTHVLAITDAPVLPGLQPNPVVVCPLLAPINAELFATKFTNDVAKLSSLHTAPGSLMPVPYWDDRTRSQQVTLPVVPLVAPHPPSLPLLLFYGMGLYRNYEPMPALIPPSPGSPRSDASSIRPPSRRRSNETSPLVGSSIGLLSTYLLPSFVIEEYPNADAMAARMRDACTFDELETYSEYNNGFWRNILSLAPVDKDIMDIAHIAWNVTKEARWQKLRMNGFEGRGRRPSIVAMAPPPTPTT